MGTACGLLSRAGRVGSSGRRFKCIAAVTQAAATEPLGSYVISVN